MKRFALALLCLLAPLSAQAQDGPAHAAFGQFARPTDGTPGSFGTYTRGCLAGGAILPETAPLWQAMKPARNRFWGHPEMIQFIKRLATKTRDIGWPGLYIGDIGQPRGGPMKSGHRSHQMGLDVDIWLREPKSWQMMSRKDRNAMWSHVVVAKNGIDLNSHWTPSHHQVLRAAASDPAVARIFVNAAIKRWMCNRERGPDGRVDAPWLRKIRPWKGHNAHFHVRLKCPVGDRYCRDQGAPPPGPGCGAELSKWFPGGAKTRSLTDPTENIPSEEEGEDKFKWGGRKGKTKAISLSAMPQQCRAVIAGNAAALAQINSASSRVVRQIELPVFYDERAEAHEGFVGTKYFWRPTVDLNAARTRNVSLRAKGRLPAGLKFRDKGSGNALLSGTPTEAGDFSFTIVARSRGRETGRQDVRLSVTSLGNEGRPVTDPADTRPRTDPVDPKTPPKDEPIATGPKDPADNDLPKLPTTGQLGTGGDTDISGGTTIATGPRTDPFRKDPLTASLEHQIKDFVTDFTGEECFLAIPTRIAAADIRFETFADDKAPILAFDRSFLQAIGVEPKIGGRIIAQAQCPSLAFVRAHPYGSPTPIETDPGGRAIAPGEPITIAVAAARVRHLAMMVVWPDGQIFDLTDHLERRGNRYAVTLKASGRGPQVLVALDSAEPLTARAREAAVRKRDLFAATGTERGGALDLRASVALIVVD